jgi:hypothetical protein
VEQERRNFLQRENGDARDADGFYRAGEIAADVKPVAVSA